MKWSQILKHDILLGDANCHDAQWDDHTTDNRGPELAEALDDLAYGTPNDGSPTRLPSNQELSSPDVSIVQENRLANYNWEVICSMSSDHLPIVITWQQEGGKGKAAKRTFINFAQANWSEFQNELDDLISNKDKPLAV